MKLLDNRFTGQILVILVSMTVALFVFSCANRTSGPTGGPRDSIPPVVQKTVPLNGALNFRKKSIEIYFDENVQIEKATENIVVSPPQIKLPEVKTNGSSVSVDLQQDLIANTTYTINFGNAIVDLNEKNPLKNYSFSFSTGNEIDTLKIAGTVINAENLNPQKGVLVGIYQEDNDSVFFKKSFMRIAKTDEHGHFVILNVRKGKYRIYALEDTNNDYYYQTNEGCAFIDSLVLPTAVTRIKNDTVWKDSVKIDTIKKVTFTDFQPDNILLKFFKSSYKRQFLARYERKQPECFSLFFNTTQAQLPKIRPLNFKWENKYIVQKNNALDSLTFWLKDTLLIKQDTLSMAVTYMKSDTLNRLVENTDTLNLIMRHLKTASYMKTPVKPVVPLKVNTNLSASFDYFNSVYLKFDSPLLSAGISGIHLNEKVDSVYKPIRFLLQKIDSASMIYKIDYKWEPEKNYELKIDSASFKDLYGNASGKFASQFKTKSLEEYSSINIILQPSQPKAVIQVLDSKENVVAQKEDCEKGAHIEHIRPGTYYLRLFVDVNGNGKWDTGDVAKKIAPESVYYYPKKLSLMANWEFEETWEVNTTPLLKQKPKELYESQLKK